MIAVVAAVVLLGGGGLVVAYGVGTVSAFVTGNQVGTERLVNSVRVNAEGVTAEVESVQHTKDFTRVTLVVRNGLRSTISLPLYGNATLSADDGATLEADAFRSSWSETIAPGQTRRGVLVFRGNLPERATTATIAFATVFEQGFDGPDSLVVEGFRLSGVQ